MPIFAMGAGCGKENDCRVLAGTHAKRSYDELGRYRGGDRRGRGVAAVAGLVGFDGDGA